MSEEKQYTGVDVSQAIANACKGLNTTQDQLKIEVMAAGSAGFLGLFGKKKATIKVVLKKGEMKTAGRQQGKGRANRNQKGTPRKAASLNRSPERVSAEISQDNLDEVKNDLEKILQLMGFPATIEVSKEANKINAHIAGSYDEALIGPEGQTIDSIQYLMRKIISRRIDGKVMFSLDAGDYRDQRRQELEEKAVVLAEEVMLSGRTKSIPALNPAERRIVHMTLQDNQAIRSRSVGEGHFKKILIYVPTQGKKKKNR